MITPETNIHLLNVEFDGDYQNVMRFGSLNEQTSYFLSKSSLMFSNCLYQRHDVEEYMTLNMNCDILSLYNYVMFQNKNFTNKWFYAFIERIEWSSNNSSKVYLKLDVWNTYYFDYNLRMSFIERQTLETDQINMLNDYPSQGKLITVEEAKVHLSNVSRYGQYFVYCNADVTKEDTTSSGAETCQIGNYEIPCMVLHFGTSHEVANFIYMVGNKGRADRIQCAFYMPLTIGLTYTEKNISGGDLGMDLTVVESIEINKEEFDIEIPINYKVKYKKELSYPYSEIEIVDCLTGQSITLDWCKFNSPDKITLKIYPIFDELGSYKIIPRGYNGQAISYENALSVQCKCDLPIFNNSYSKYLKDNQAQNNISKTLAGFGTVSSAIHLNPEGIVNNMGNMARTIANDSQAKTIGNQVTNLNSSLIEYTNFSPGFVVRVNTLDSSHLYQARTFWKCYGYPFNRMSYPILSNNRTFNYIKTQNVCINSHSIPQNCLKILKSIYDNGVTIWDKNKFMEYGDF